jgi:atypical dual specificity phosphatase
MHGLNSIKLKSFGISFGNKIALNNVSLELSITGVTLLMGPKSSGKSSLLSSLAGIHDNNSSFKCWGEAYILDRLMGSDALLIRPVFVRPVMSQLNQSVEDIILSHYTFSRANTDSKQEFVKKLILDSKLEELLPMLQQRLIDLKPVWYRIVMIFVAAATKPPALMLDDPMKKLNANEVVLMARYIRHLGKQLKIIVALDNKTHAHEMADDIVLLTTNGVQFHGTNDAFFASPPPNNIVGQFLLTGNINNAMFDTSNLADSAISMDLYQADIVADEEITPSQNDFLLSGSAEQILSQDYKPLPHNVVTKSAIIDQANNWSNEEHIENKNSSSLSTPVETFTKVLASSSDTADSSNKIENDDSGNLGSNSFSWIVRGILAVCPMPGIGNSLGYDLDILASEGITKLITLTPEDIYQAELAAQGLSNVHIPISDGKMPSMTQMHMLLLKMKELIESGDVLAVYCLDGCGAAGIVIAAWMIKEDGVTVEEVIKKLRLINPGLIQSLVQVEFLTGFSNDVKNRVRKK